MILVTGGTGLLGSHLLLELTLSGHRVRAIRRKDAIMKAFDNVFKHQRQKESLMLLIDWVEADVLDIESLEQAFVGVTQVYHCAAVVSFDPMKQSMMKLVNVTGTANMVNMALHNRVNHFVFVSSIATLGSTLSGEPVSEGEPWDSLPKGSVYGQSKHDAEREVWRGMAEGLQAVIVNPSVILGPGDWAKGSSELFTAVWNGLKYYTQGMNGYVDVRDVAKVMVKLAEIGIVNQRFVVSGANVSYQDLFDAIAAGLKRPKPVKEVSPLMGEFAWRLFAIVAFFSRKRPFITRETARASQKKYRYSSQKLILATGFRFTPFDETINYVAGRFLVDRNIDHTHF